MELRKRLIADLYARAEQKLSCPIYLVHEIHSRALKLQGVRAARLEIVELYGNWINILHFFWIILACESWAYGSLELSLLPVAPQKSLIFIFAAFSAFVW